MTTLKLQTIKEYKISIAYDNDYNKKKHKENKEQRIRQIEQLKKDIKELQQQNKKVFVKKTFTMWDYKEHIRYMREWASERNWLVIENKDSEVKNE